MPFHSIPLHLVWDSSNGGHMPDMTQDEFDERVYAAIQRAFSLSIPPESIPPEEELLEKLARSRPLILNELDSRRPSYENLRNKVSRQNELLEEGVHLMERMLHGPFGAKRGAVIDWLKKVNNIDTRRDDNGSGETLP
jgi:hypothetical protein